jgi:hypothetical protein
MASSQTPLPHKTGPEKNQTAYLPGFQDFGFDALEISNTENTAPAPLVAEDFGFDDPDQSGMDGAEDFGMDGLTLPEALQFARTSAAPQPEAQGDEDFRMDSASSPDD